MMNATNRNDRSRFLPGWGVRAPVVVLLLAVLLKPVWGRVVNDPATANMVVVLTGLVAFLVYVIWFLTRSGLSARSRWLLLLFVVILPAGTFSLLFVPVGVSGALVPEFAWRWNDRGPAGAPVPHPGLVPDLTLSAATDFPAFLGPGRSGIVPDVGLSTDWSAAAPQELWRRPIGEGWSGFAVRNGFAVTMAQYGPEEHTLCLDASTGRVAWTHVEQARHETAAGGVGPRATPTIHEGLVYSLGATGILNCLDGRDGSVRWRVDLLDLTGLDQEAVEKLVSWGRAGSPLLVDEMVVVPGGGPTGASVSLIAFDARSGEELWRGGTDQIGYSSPAVGTLGGRRQIISVNEKSVSGHDPADGRTLWIHSFRGSSKGNATASQAVVVDDGHVFFSKGYGVGARLLTLTPAPDGAFTCEVVWQERRRLRTKFTNPILLDGRLHGLNERRVECVNVADGLLVWSGERYGHAQCLAVGPSLLILGDDGSVSLVDREDGEEHGRFQAIEGKTWCVPSLAGDLLFVRNSAQAACYRLPTR
jgi:outer membrane protein assembly factor BamB